MSKTIYFAAATLDGYISDPDDGIEWLTGFEPNYEGTGEEGEGAIDAFISDTGAWVRGSSTYEFTPARAGVDGARPNGVLTSRELPPIEGADIRFHNGSVADI